MTDELYLQKLGKKIALLRKERKLSQEELADISGKMINTISNIERGLSDPKITTLLAIAEALDVQLQDLLLDFSCYTKEYTGIEKRILSLLDGKDEKILKIASKQIEALLEVECEK